MSKSQRPRRNRALLEEALAAARGAAAKASAHYALALFHDNNSRESEAIPHYKRALVLGLPRPIKAQALAWLASSLYKTRYPEEALATLAKAMRLTSDPQLRRFLDGLERRISRSP
jgi:tetratricopeptide (TPR) repeat protein